MKQYDKAAINWLIIFIFLTAFDAILLGIYIKKPAQSAVNGQVEKKRIEPVEIEVKGNSMEPMIKNGDTVFYYQDFYEYNEPQKGDLAAYDHNGNHIAELKIIKATHQDELKVLDGKLYINDRPMRNSEGKTYIFSAAEQKMLSLYIKNGHLPQGACYLFGDNTSSSLDSRKYGAVGIDSLLGKFIIK